MKKTASAPLKARLGKIGLRTWVRWIGLGIAGLWALAAVLLVGARWIDPPTTMVHVERRVQAWIHGTPYPFVSSGPIRFIDLTLWVATEVGPRKTPISPRPILRLRKNRRVISGRRYGVGAGMKSVNDSESL